MTTTATKTTWTVEQVIRNHFCESTGAPSRAGRTLSRHRTEAAAHAAAREYNQGYHDHDAAVFCGLDYVPAAE